jgi:hypothetical protein
MSRLISEPLVNVKTPTSKSLSETCLAKHRQDDPNVVPKFVRLIALEIRDELDLVRALGELFACYRVVRSDLDERLRQRVQLDSLAQVRLQVGRRGNRCPRRYAGQCVACRAPIRS